MNGCNEEGSSSPLTPQKGDKAILIFTESSCPSSEDDDSETSARTDWLYSRLIPTKRRKRRRKPAFLLPSKKQKHKMTIKSANEKVSTSGLCVPPEETMSEEEMIDISTQQNEQLSQSQVDMIDISTQQNEQLVTKPSGHD